MRAKPDVVFNRVESLGGSDSMMAAITLLLDAMRDSVHRQFERGARGDGEQSLRERTPSPSRTARRPRWINADRRWADNGNAKFILKSVYEHASFELDDTSIVCVTGQKQITALLHEREAATGRGYFAEEFIDGREFNLSLIGPGPRVLPPAEIDFSTFPRGKERIVGHSAKCDQTSFEYHNTDRIFDFPASDQRLLQRISELAVECWRLFELCGYARRLSR